MVGRQPSCLRAAHSTDSGAAECCEIMDSNDHSGTGIGGAEVQCIATG